MSKLKLKDLYTLTNAVFTDLQELDVPWKESGINTELDIAYMGNQSGQKYISPLVEQFVEDGELSSANRGTIASVLFALYGDNWSKLYATLSFEYNPIENYHMIETHTGSDTSTQTPTNWQKTTERTPDTTLTETQTPTNWNETESYTNYHETTTETPTNWKKTTTSLTADNEGNSENSVVPFNGSSPVLASKVKTDAKSKSEEAQTGTFEHDTTKSGSISHGRSGTFETQTVESGTDTTTETQEGTYETETEYDTELERSGNIGVTTSQQMIESERNLWLWNFFYKVVFPDVDKVLTLAIY